MKQILAAVMFLSVLFSIQPEVSLAAKEVTKFQVPDPNKDFCGPEMQAAFCQCALYGNSCDVMKMTQENAFSFVDREFRAWVANRIKETAEQCIIDDGYWNTATRQCIRCTDGDVRNGNKCLPPGSEVITEVDGQCRMLLDFAKDWKQYSDFNSTTADSGVSSEVNEYNRILDILAQKISEVQATIYNMEVDKLVRAKLHAYKTSLSGTADRAIITKYIFDVAWITYHTEKGATNEVGSYRTLVLPDTATKVLSDGIASVQQARSDVIGYLEFDKNLAVEKIKSLAWGSSLQALRDSFDPKSIAQQALSDTESKVPAVSELTEEQVAILREQHIQNLAIDKAVAESYAENAQRRQKLLGLEKEVSDLYSEMEEWRSKEYVRVKSEMETSCQK